MPYKNDLFSSYFSGTHACNYVYASHHAMHIVLLLQDFNDQTTILQNEVEGRGHVCLYLPKFHCELNPIENCWCYAKKHTRAHCNGSIVRLRKIIPEAFDTVTKDMIARFFCKCDDYQAAYLEGHSCHTVDKTIKQYKSHRRVAKCKSDSND